MYGRYRQAAALILLVVICQLLCGCGQSNDWKTIDLANGLAMRFRVVDSKTKADLNSVSVIGNGAGYIAGDQNVLLSKSAKGNWQAIPSSSSRHFINLSSVSSLSSESAWIVGRVISVKGSRFQSQPLIEHYNGTVFKSERTPTKAVNPSVFMLSESSGWAGGILPGVLWRYDGNQWKTAAVPTDSMVGPVAFKSEEKGWAIAHGLLQFDNGGWQQIGSYFPVPMMSLLPMNDGTILVGGIGRLLRYSSDVVTEIPGFTGRTISSMAEIGGGAVILVGGDAAQDTGRIMFLSNGKKLASEIDLPQDHFLTSVSCDSQTHGWIVGHSGTLIEFRIERL